MKEQIEQRSLEIRPARSHEAGLFFAMEPEQDKEFGCIGHVRMDFGHHGKEFWHTWFPQGPEELNSPEFCSELDSVVDELRKTVLMDLSGMRRYCTAHGGAISGGWQKNYGYVVETERYLYFLRCNPVEGDYQAYLTCFDKQIQEMHQASKLAEGLPEACYSVMPSTGTLICIKRGERGYYTSGMDTGDRKQNEKLANSLNEELHITPTQRLAMEVGSMFGWTVPGAAPTAYDQQQTKGGMTLA